MNPERLAFNTSLYLRNQGGIEAFFSGQVDDPRRLAVDLARLVIETAGSQEDRITPYTLQATGSGQVISPEFGDDDLITMLTWETPAEKLESKATLRIRDYLLARGEKPALIIWVSPADESLGYSEGRVMVGFSRVIDGLKIAQCYGICADIQTDQFGMSTNKLRETPFIFENADMGYLQKMAEQLIPLPDIWARIKSSEARVLHEQALEHARQALLKVQADIVSNGRSLSPIEFGAHLELEMRSRGWGMENASSCGATNTDLLQSSFSSFNVDGAGRQMLTGSEKGTFVRKCPYCGATINRVISPGFTCSCGQTYHGTCG
ncbi:hypothetical protein ACFLZP_04905 [Patescibacteria group bacterium]